MAYGEAEWRFRIPNNGLPGGVVFARRGGGLLRGEVCSRMVGGRQPEGVKSCAR
jgi:hypothetical protein